MFKCLQEYLAKKNDHSLFTFGFSSKKRPNSLVIGRTFNFEVLDMFELAIVNYKPMEDFKVLTFFIEHKLK